MQNPILPFIEKLLGPEFVPLWTQRVVGLAKDFWADGPVNLLNLDFNLKKNAPSSSRAAKSQPQHSHSQQKSQPKVAAEKPAENLWHAQPGEISEKMWGPGFITPGGVTISSMLVKPLGITKEMSVLDLSAGLGGRIRRIADESKAYITGLEPDAGIAARGMQLSIKAGKAKHATIIAYDPGKLTLDRSYDVVIARETFYRVPDRIAFLSTIGKHAKPRAQIAYTDYIVDAENREHPSILAWFKNEKLANPMGLVETAENWAQVGFTIRVHEDLSDFYKTEVVVGMKRLMDHLASGVKPDRETSEAVLRRIETWKHRIAAMDAGMKFYRFYGSKS